jgi:hypothetical protein
MKYPHDYFDGKFLLYTQKICFLGAIIIDTDDDDGKIVGKRNINGKKELLY